MVSNTAATGGVKGRLLRCAKNLPKVAASLAHHSSSGRSVWITLACPISGRDLSDVMRTVRAEAPDGKLEWLSAPGQVYDAVAEGLVFIAHLGGETRMPDGRDAVEVAPFHWTSFPRGDHPALADWGPDAWSRYPHVQVNTANGARSPLDTPAGGAPPDRSIGALISKFASLGPLLANSDRPDGATCNAKDTLNLTGVAQTDTP